MGDRGVDLWLWIPLALLLPVVAHTDRQEEEGRPGAWRGNTMTLVPRELSLDSPGMAEVRKVPSLASGYWGNCPKYFAMLR